MRIAFTSSNASNAKESLAKLSQLYGTAPPEEADVIVALGGDGHTLKTLHDYAHLKKPIFSMRQKTSVGFLCNDYRAENLIERLTIAKKIILNPLRAEITHLDNKVEIIHAFNEVTTLRDSPQSAHLRIRVNGVTRFERYIGDGILVATPSGSTGYNSSAGGPIMPLNANTLVLTAICAHQPRHWKNAIMGQDDFVEIENMDCEKRPLRIETDAHSTHHIKSVRIRLDKGQSQTLMFDPGADLDEKILREQFPHLG